MNRRGFLAMLGAVIAGPKKVLEVFKKPERPEKITVWFETETAVRFDEPHGWLPVSIHWDRKNSQWYTWTGSVWIKSGVTWDEGEPDVTVTRMDDDVQS